MWCACLFFFFFQAEDGIRDLTVTGVQTCALPISGANEGPCQAPASAAAIRASSPGQRSAFEPVRRTRAEAGSRVARLQDRLSERRRPVREPHSPLERSGGGLSGDSERDHPQLRAGDVRAGTEATTGQRFNPSLSRSTGRK